MKPRDISFDVPGAGSVSALLMMPADPQCLLVFAHGAGAGMKQPFMETMSRKLVEQGIGTFRYQFPYMEKRQRRPDSKPVLFATVQAAVKTARELGGKIPLIAGGKSMGGRMTSNAAAEGLLPDIRGIVFFGFPLHPPTQHDKWSERAEHLSRVNVPMLFLQGTRDAFADLKLLRPVCKGLGKLATLHLIEGADHSFRPEKSSSQNGSDVLEDIAGAVRKWSRGLKRDA